MHFTVVPCPSHPTRLWGWVSWWQTYAMFGVSDIKQEHQAVWTHAEPETQFFNKLDSKVENQPRAIQMPTRVIGVFTPDVKQWSYRQVHFGAKQQSCVNLWWMNSTQLPWWWWWGGVLLPWIQLFVSLCERHLQSISGSFQICSRNCSVTLCFQDIAIFVKFL